MKILVIGLGSMGKRRLRLLQAFWSDFLLVGVDASESRRQQTEATLGIDCYDSLTAALVNFQPDAAFVSTPPLTHGEIIGILLANNVHVFSEINLTDDQYDENISLAVANHKVLFLSSTPLYRKEIEFISRAAKGKEKLSYRYHVGQYLPDWHPWENYTDFFVGDRATSGIRELFAIEFPWLIDTFGEVESFSNDSRKLTNLAIDYDDCHLLTFQHHSGTVGQLIFDLVCRKPIRQLLVFGEDTYIYWGGTPASLTYYDIDSKSDVSVNCYSEVMQDDRYAENIVENAYVAEIEWFLNEVANESELRPKHSFETDKISLSLIERILR